jgi:hypothetical protein
MAHSGSHPRPVKRCPPSLIGKPVPNSTWTGPVILIKRGGTGQQSGSGPSGWKLRPAARLARSLAEMARPYKVRGAARALADKVHGDKSHAKDSTKILNEFVKEIKNA